VDFRPRRFSRPVP